ncbi:MAG: hypothetical protein IJA52_08750 [Clostridia bacterium]|nr:hypothetical protein [Clostridia bacterium]
MLLINYDFYDIHFVLIMLREYPEKPYNAQIIQNIIQILSEPQIGNSLDDNNIRKNLRTIETIEKENFRWVFVDNIYTYGLKVIKDRFCYSFLEKAFRKLLECAVNEDYEQLEILADALHNVPILFAEDCKNFKKAVKIQFAQYNSIYKANLLKELSN